MATVSADGRTFLVNNKRHWIVGGVAGYAGVPRELWKPRLRRVREAGVNTVVVPAEWAVHEPVPGRFTFEGEADLAHFCRLAGECGLYAIVRVGPFVGGRSGLGGMPPWILNAAEESETLRTYAPTFAAAVSKWLGALTGVLAPLQATNADDAADPRQTGQPVIAVQSEHHWTSGADAIAADYFAHLTRYLREGGIKVPVLTLNNMFAHAEGAIEAWSGYANLHTVARQLHAALPDEPPIVGEVEATVRPVVGEPASDAKSGRAVQRVLAEVLAGSGQFVVGDFAPSAPRSFRPGQFTHSNAAFATASPARAFVAEDASPGHAYHAARRVCLFADTFARVLGGVDADRADATISPGASAPAIEDERTGARSPEKPAVAGVTIETVRGASGAVAFLFADDTKSVRQKPVPLTLPSGIGVSVEVGTLAVSWVLLDTHLVADKRLDYATLPAFLHDRRLLVVFGAAGASGAVCINGTPAGLSVPSGKKPAVCVVDGVTVVVCNEQQADAAILHEGVAYIGATSVDDAGQPVPAPGFKSVAVVGQDGGQKTVSPKATAASAPRLTLTDWAVAGASAFTTGASDRYARIDGPASTAELGTPEGYAWYRLRFKHNAAKRTKVAAFGAADRLHLFLDETKPKVLGDGPDAPGRIAQVSLKNAEHTLVALADNMGLPNSGFRLRTPKGLWDHLYEVTPLKVKPTVETVGPVDLLDHYSPIEGVHRGDTTHPDRLTWSFTHRKKSPIFLRMDYSDWTGLVMLNGEVIAAFTPGSPVSLKLDHETLNRGKNTLEFAVMGRDAEARDTYKKQASIVALYEGVAAITEKAEWAFAGWEAPAAGEFEPIAKSGLSAQAAKRFKGAPVWWSAAFGSVEDPYAVPIRLDCKGLSKGHIVLNGTPTARYWVQTQDGNAVPPESEVWLPPDLLRTEADNQLLIFDEHGFPPSKVAIKVGPLNA